MKRLPHILSAIISLADSDMASGDVDVRLMYNEKDQTLPLADQSLAPYYRWSDFKSYYTPVVSRARELCERLRSQE